MGERPENPQQPSIKRDAEERKSGTSESSSSHEHLVLGDGVLEEAGTGLDRVVKSTCFLQHMSDFGAFNEVYAKHFPNNPARSCFEVAALPKGALVEIEVIAEV